MVLQIRKKKKIEQVDNKEDDEYPIRTSQNIPLQSIAQQPENPEQPKDTEHPMEQKVPTREAAQTIQEQPEDQVGQPPPESFANCKPHKGPATQTRQR